MLKCLFTVIYYRFLFSIIEYISFHFFNKYTNFLEIASMFIALIISFVLAQLTEKDIVEKLSK